MATEFHSCAKLISLIKSKPNQPWKFVQASRGMIIKVLVNINTNLSAMIVKIIETSSSQTSICRLKPNLTEMIVKIIETNTSQTSIAAIVVFITLLM